MRRRAVVVVLCALVAAMLSPSATAAPRRASDPMRRDQWGFGRVKAAAAWRVSTGRGVVVAVIDTGIDLGHPDMKGRLVRGANFVKPKTPPQDDHGHGTHVAGVIAAATGNGVGISGIAPDAKLMPVKVLNANGAGTLDAIVDGIRYAADHGAKVLNLSLGLNGLTGLLAGTAGQLDPLYEATAYAWSKGAVVIAAAGNSGSPLCSEPAASENVVCVGALDRADNLANYSDYDVTMTKWFVCAPGGEGWTADTGILSTVSRGKLLDGKKTGYAAISGTSMAAPHVAGIAALLAAKRMRSPDIVERLLSTATDLGLTGRDPTFGHGLVNAEAAVRG